MTTTEMNVKKKELEFVIESLLHKFSHETGYITTSIEVSLIAAFGNRSNAIAGVNMVVKDNEYPAFHVRDTVSTQES